jgi:hypothetical protein
MALLSKYNGTRSVCKDQSATFRNLPFCESAAEALNIGAGTARVRHIFTTQQNSELFQRWPQLVDGASRGSTQRALAIDAERSMHG